MEEKRVNKSIKNIIYALGGQFLGIIISLIARVFFVKYLSTEYLGISNLFTNVLTMLSLTEMGFGTAMAYELYKPIADGNTEKIKSLMKLYKKIYTIIGIIIFVLGFVTLPIYPYLINEKPNIANLDLIYILFVINTSFSYFVTYKRLLIISDQNRYIATYYRYLFYFLLNVAQIIELYIFKSYILFLVVQIIFTLLENIALSIKANKMYPYLKEKESSPVEKEVKSNLFKTVKAIFFHKFGGVVLNSTDNIVISKVLGLSMAGLYSNYYFVINAINTIFNQIFNSIIASIGNLNTTNDRNKMTNIFNKIFFANAWIYAIICSGILIVINPFIKFWLGEQYLLSTKFIVVLDIYMYLYGMRRTAMAYREATGNYQKDWYSPIIEAIINVISSIIFVKYFGIVGIFMGTILSSLCTNFWLEPVIVCRNSLSISIKSYFIQYAKYMLITMISVILSFALSKTVLLNGMSEVVLKGIISVVIPMFIFIFVYRKNENYIYYKKLLCEKILKRVKFVSNG